MVPRLLTAVSWLLQLLLISSEAALLPRNLQGFGVGGSLDTETPPPVIVTVASTEVPYSAPTAFPSPAPTAFGTVKPGENWAVSVFSYYYELYAASSAGVLQAVAQVDVKATETLRRLVFRQSAPATVQRLDSQVLGAYYYKDYEMMMEKRIDVATTFSGAMFARGACIVES